MLIENFSTLLAEKITGESIVSEIKINAAHPLFDGHFPENPITPGVVMIQLFKEQAERFTGKKLQVTKASNIKFLSVIDPIKEPEVQLDSKINEKGEEIVLMGKALLQDQMVSMKLKLTFKIVAS